MGLLLPRIRRRVRPVRVLYDRRDSAWPRLVRRGRLESCARGAAASPLRGHGRPCEEPARRSAESARRSRSCGSAGLVRRQLPFRACGRPRKRASSCSRSFPRARYLFVGSDDAEMVFKLPVPPDDVLTGLRALARARSSRSPWGGGLGGAARRRDCGAPTSATRSRWWTAVGAGDAYAALSLAKLTGRSANRPWTQRTALAALKCTSGRRAARHPGRAGGVAGLRQHRDPPLAGRGRRCGAWSSSTTQAPGAVATVSNRWQRCWRPPPRGISADGASDRVPRRRHATRSLSPRSRRPGRLVHGGDGTVKRGGSAAGG